MFLDYWTPYVLRFRTTFLLNLNSSLNQLENYNFKKEKLVLILMAVLYKLMLSPVVIYYSTQKKVYQCQLAADL